MPTYDYKCNACGHTFELFQQMSDSVKRRCPECGKPKLERLIGIGAGVLFKGGGFYETDYRSDSYTKAAEAEKKAAEGKSETAKTPESSSASTGDKTADANATPQSKETKSSSDASDSGGSAKKSPRKPIAKPAPKSKFTGKASRKR